MAFEEKSMHFFGKWTLYLGKISDQKTAAQTFKSAVQNFETQKSFSSVAQKSRKI